MPMHTFGFPVHLDELIKVCNLWKIPIVEDAAESLGSQYKGMPPVVLEKLGHFLSMEIKLSLQVLEVLYYKK